MEHQAFGQCHNESFSTLLMTIATPMAARINTAIHNSLDVIFIVPAWLKIFYNNCFSTQY